MCLFNLFNVAIIWCLSVYCELATKIVEKQIFSNYYCYFEHVWIQMYHTLCMLMFHVLIHFQNVPEISCMYCLVPNSKELYTCLKCACMYAVLPAILTLFTLQLMVCPQDLIQVLMSNICHTFHCVSITLTSLEAGLS